MTTSRQQLLVQTNFTGMDTETLLIKRGQIAPPIVCASFASPEDDLGELVASDDMGRLREYIEQALKLAAQRKIWLSMHNGYYDLGVILNEWPELFPLVYDVLDSGRYFDTQTCEWLLDTADGTLGDNEGKPVKKGWYKLDRLARTYCEISMEKDVWQKKYGEFRGVPVPHYPEGARAYAKLDAVAARKVAERQLARAVRMDPFPLKDLAAQCHAYFALHLISSWGICTEAEAVERFGDSLRAEMVELLPKLVETGVYSLKNKGGFKKNTKYLRELVVKAFAEQGKKPPMSKPSGKFPAGQVQTGLEVLEDSGHEELLKIADFDKTRKVVTTYLPHLRRGATLPVHPSYGFAATGRTSSYEPNIQNLPRKAGVRECFIPRDGRVFSSVDYGSLEMCTLAQACLDLVHESRLARALNSGLDPHLIVAAQLLKIPYEEALKRYKNEEEVVAEKRQMAKCFHPDTETLTPTGWKRISELVSGDLVAQAWPERGAKALLQWVEPTQLTERPCPEGELILLRNEGIDLRVTRDHRMLGFGAEKGREAPKVLTPETLNSSRFWLNAGELEGEQESGMQPDERTLRLAVATQADGTMSYGKTIRFGFTKIRKVKRLRALLEGLPYEEYSRPINGKKGYFFAVEGGAAKNIARLLDADKTFPWSWLKFARGTRDWILEEAQYWDSHVVGSGRSYGYTSAKRKNCEVLQALASLSGRKTRLTMKPRKKAHHSDLWLLSVKDRARSRGGSLTPVVEKYAGKVVCLSVPSSFVLVRDGGTPVIVGQCLNFGLPGGLGAPKFVKYVRTNGDGMSITLAESKKLKEDWFEAWPEMKKYFEYVSNKSGDWGEDGGTFIQLRSGRVRGKVGFTDGANGYFQALAADGAKAATAAVVRECYDPRHKSSPLYGSRIVAMVHDELVGEHPIDRAHEAAMRISEIMVREMKRFVPDVAITAEPCLMRRWYKKAKPVFDASGRLVPWEPKLKENTKDKQEEAA